MADSASAARRFHESVEGYERGEANAERVVALPDALITTRGWRNGPGGNVYARAGWPRDELLVACGGEVAPLPTDRVRRQMQTVCKDVRFGSRVFRAGDIATNSARFHGIARGARLSVFRGGKAED